MEHRVLPECRTRVMGELEKAGDERIERERERETERFYEDLEEDENKRKKAKTEETIGVEQPGSGIVERRMWGRSLKKSRRSAFGGDEQEEGR